MSSKSIWFLMLLKLDQVLGLQNDYFIRLIFL